VAVDSEMPPQPSKEHQTLENVYDTKVRQLIDEAGTSVGEDAIQYMLKSIPFIRQYNERGPSDDHALETATKFDAAGFRVSQASTKHQVFSNFMAQVEGDYASYTELQPKVRATSRGHSQHEWICVSCDAAKVYNPIESCVVCPVCGDTAAYTEMSQSNLTFDESISLEVSNNCAYKRSNHFSEWIISLQAKESTVIPDNVLDAIRIELKKARITTCVGITPIEVKKYLKKLRLSKWYEHTHSICAALGTPALSLSPVLEQKLKTMFQEIQAPFDKWVKIVAPKRKNFLSYSYVLYKFCQLLGEDDLLQHFPLLKSKEKLRNMDVIWKRICTELRWEYIPSC
jgi:hypothetical protein